LLGPHVWRCPTRPLPPDSPRSRSQVHEVKHDGYRLQVRHATSAPSLPLLLPHEGIKRVLQQLARTPNSSMDRQTRPPTSAHSARGRLDGRASGARPHQPHPEVLDGWPEGSLAHPAEAQESGSLAGETKRCNTGAGSVLIATLRTASSPASRSPPQFPGRCSVPICCSFK
jgi:hypothetical protein